MLLGFNAAAVNELSEMAPLVGVVVFMVSFVVLRQFWLVWRLRRWGIPVTATVTDDSGVRDARPYQVRFQTQRGQWVEAYSCGWHLVNPEYFVGEQTVVYYDEQEPARCLLAEEAGILPVFGPVALLVLGIIGLALAAVHKLLQ